MMPESRAPMIWDNDPLLQPHRPAIENRMARVQRTAKRLTGGKTSLADFASGHEYFGLRQHPDGWVFREWAPNAQSIHLIGNMTGWQEKEEFRLRRISDDGIWELRLPPEAIRHEDYYRLRLTWPGGGGDRIPSYARRVVKDLSTLIFNAQVWQPPHPYQWKIDDFKCPSGALFIYEAHVGMAQEEGKVGTYREFTRNIIPRIAAAGYNAIQLMAIPEHPYYGSFGYHVSNFFAPSSQFGTPYELKELIDAAHGRGLAVIMDIVHSHAVKNEVEGLARFDGTSYQYFHEGDRGIHHAWDSRCFDYSKPQVLHFLLSNCRFWLDEFRFDGFRFDGITSMLYLHHGLGGGFVHYDQYFDPNVDEDAVTYLTLANKVIHEVRADAVTIAEDISGMPGLGYPMESGGIGFDYRFAMGIPDLWAKIIQDVKDEDWPVGHIFYELTNRRHDEKSISYAESHDQALVGDKTLIFRLIDKDMYDGMSVFQQNLQVDRGIALHKMIRLITLATAGHGYLNFMGNEFGHPEWIDFPREGNQWSYHYARRQWHLAETPHLKYQYLARFDKEMLDLVKRYNLLERQDIIKLHDHGEHKTVVFWRAGLILAFNFHPADSYPDYTFQAPPGSYRLVLDSDAKGYGGQDRLELGQRYFTQLKTAGLSKQHVLSVYLPTRSAVVLEKVD